MLLAFCDYVSHYLHRDPTIDEIQKIAEIIAWNVWQMDGLTGLLPFERPQEEELELDLFEDLNIDSGKTEIVILDWKRNKQVPFTMEKKMKLIL